MNKVNAIFIRKLVIHSFIFYFLSILMLVMSIIGSGILPIPVYFLLLMVIPIAVLSGFLSALLRKWWGFILRIALIVISFLLTGILFMHFVLTGFSHAKLYGSNLAAAVEQFRAEDKNWPQSLDEIPKDMLPTFDPRNIKPYICYRGKTHYEKVAGFFISYELNESKPELYVGRRDMSAIWNWDTKQWDKLR